MDIGAAPIHIKIIVRKIVGTCNMDISMAAEALFIHRNTMVFRLNQLKKQLNLNPFHKDNDRFKLILLYHYFTKKYNGNKKVMILK